MKPKFYIPASSKGFQRFTVGDRKEWPSQERVEVHLSQNPGAEEKLRHKCREVTAWKIP